MDFSKTAQAARKLFDKLTDSGGRHLTPAAELTINGRFFGTQTIARITRIQLTDKRGFEADELSVDLDDHDGSIAIPTPGDLLTLALGYTETGIVDKGEYLFSDFSCSGAPDTMNITARSANLAETLAQQKERSWHGKTPAAIVEAIAGEHGYTPKIAEQYKQETIKHIDQTNESDAAFLSRLAEQYGAIATVKQNHLLFIPEGGMQTASGEPVPPLEIVRQAGDSHRFSYSATQSYEAVRAYYTDKKTGQKKEVIINEENLQPEKKKVTATKVHQYKRPRRDKKTGKIKTQSSKTTTKTVNVVRKVDTQGKKIKTLRHLYATEHGAASGARAAFKRLKRGAAKFEITLAVGRPDITPETPVRVSGFKPEIDNQAWLIVEVAHSIDSGGYTCRVQLEAQPDFDGGEDEKDNAADSGGKEPNQPKAGAGHKRQQRHQRQSAKRRKKAA